MPKFGTAGAVTVLTGAALAAVTVLAVQAQGSANTTASGDSAKPTASASASPSKAKPKPPPAVPADSGSGKRIVFSLKAKRVWLVDPTTADPQKVQRTFTVQPSTVLPLASTYTVQSVHEAPYSGSDGVRIKNGVIFADRQGVYIGFSSAIDGATPRPDPNEHTGGVRETVADGQALFDFAPVGTKVVVVP